MTPMWKRSAGLLVASALVGITACSSGSDKNSGASTAPSASASAAPTAVASATPAAPAKFKLYISDYSVAVPPKDNASLKYMMQKTNTDIDIQTLPHGQYADQLKLKFAAGDFPDVYSQWSPPEQELVDSGKILELNALIDKYGQNLKKVIPQTAWDAVTQGGKILAIPQPSLAQTGSILYIRKDWLDKLNLQIPKTSDELLNVLKAFRDGDPNGNGKKDEIPFTMREKISWGDNIFSMWGVLPTRTRYFNNEVIYGGATPDIKKGLEYLANLYKEKLLDQEFLTNSRSVWEQKIKSGVVGVWAHDPSLSAQWQTDLTNSLQGAKPDVITIPTPKGVGYDGPVGTSISPVAKTFIIFKSAKNPEAIVKWLDWLVTAEGQAYTEYGVEGDTYKKDGANIVYNADKDKNDKNDWRKNWFQMHGYNDDVMKAKSSPADYAKLSAAYKVANGEGIVNQQVGMVTAKNNANYDTMYLEAASKVILGAAPSSSYDTFISTWRKQGGDAMIKEETDWYNKYRKK
ncbi:extracellular solute-binding protein [Paenibacillus cymbidii]|uniref:extracellular solute-binding protein n=1 Tax=Paenibacillus cymbidii TaxID=1639034 RepID=UPI001080B5BD|nr:extracellular solute-binding protein [Paenibacillus cymbidii]